MLVKKCNGSDFSTLLTFCSKVNKADLRLAQLDKNVSTRLMSLLNSSTTTVIAAYSGDGEILGLAVVRSMTKPGKVTWTEHDGIIKAILVPQELKQTNVIEVLLTISEQVLKTSWCNKIILCIPDNEDYFLRENAKSLGYHLIESSCYRDFEKNIAGVEINLKKMKDFNKGERE